MNFDFGNYFKEENTVYHSVNEETKEELFFKFNGFKNPETAKDIKAIANMIHSLLFLEKNTYPDCPDMGIGIQNYQFELMNDTTLEKIRTSIHDQINKYLPTIYLKNLVVKKINNVNITKALGIGFEVATKDFNVDQQFFILLNDKPDTRDLISQIYY